MLEKLSTLQFAHGIFSGFPDVDVFEDITFDDFDFKLKIKVIDEEKYFIIISRNVILGYTQNPFIAFEYKNSASILTHAELNLLAKGLNILRNRP